MQGEAGSHSSGQTFSDLREKHGFTIVGLADKSGVPPFVVYYMLLGRPVSRLQASQVIRGLSDLSGVAYVLGDIHVPVVDDGV